VAMSGGADPIHPVQISELLRKRVRRNGTPLARLSTYSDPESHPVEVGKPLGNAG